MSVRSEASYRARNLYTSSGCRAAYVAGATAAADGRAITDCPHRPEERVTWRTSLRRAWERGYDSVVQDVE
jgi:hypothetical protein